MNREVKPLFYWISGFLWGLTLGWCIGFFVALMVG